VDFVSHVFLAERRAFYDIERLRKSARPLTPAQFDAELKEALTAKTREARGKKPAGNSKKGTKAAGAVKGAPKSAAKKAPAKKSAALKTASKKSAKKS
jgi:ribosome-associated protein